MTFSCKWLLRLFLACLPCHQDGRTIRLNLRGPGGNPYVTTILQTMHQWCGKQLKSDADKVIYLKRGRLQRSSVRRIPRYKDYEPGQDKKFFEELRNLFEAFYESEKNGIDLNVTISEKFGFNIGKRKSSILDAGDGVFVTKGCIPKNTIASMYPGTIYYPADAILIQSVNNQFILRCIDGILVDGKATGISKALFRSCSGRDIIGHHKPCDTSWLTNAQNNPLAIGQYVNNQTTSSPANVVYQEVDLPISFPLHLRKYLPNINFGNKCLEEHVDHHENNTLIRIVVLVSLSDIQEDEELFSAYFTEVF